MQDKQPIKVLLTFIIMWQFAFGISNRAIYQCWLNSCTIFSSFLEKGVHSFLTCGKYALKVSKVVRRLLISNVHNLNDL